MLNGKMTMFLNSWERFRCPGIVGVEMDRCVSEGLRGVTLIAALLAHDWHPTVRQGPRVVRAILVDAVRDGLLGMGAAERRRMADAVARAVGEAVGKAD